MVKNLPIEYNNYRFNYGIFTLKDTENNETSHLKNQIIFSVSVSWRFDISALFVQAQSYKIMILISIQ